MKHERLYAQGQSRIVYDTLPYGEWLPRPFVVQTFINYNQRYAPYYINNWNDVTSRCRIAIIKSNTNEEIAKGLSFPTLLDLKSYIDNTIPVHPTWSDHFAYAFHILVYDDVDENIQTISRMYGINRLYNGLVGKKNARIATTCSDIQNSWNAGKYILWDMWRTQNTWMNFLQYDEFYTQDGHKACWTSAHYKRRHGIPPMNKLNIDTRTIRIDADGSGGRYTGCNNWEGCYPVYSATYELQNPLLYLWNEFGGGSLPPNGMIYNPQSPGERKTFRLGLYNANSSAVLFYRVKGPGVYPEPPADDVEWAIYIKPVGIDMLGINYIDITQYDLEAVFINNDSTIRFKNCTSSITQQDFNLDRCSILKSAWIYQGDALSVKQELTSQNPVSVAFRLRDKVSGKVSRLSRSRVVAQKDHKFVPLRWLVVPEERIRQ